ncbi:MAG: hypothetical protein AAGJ97_09415, partial [Planctomycetota bacterium]
AEGRAIAEAITASGVTRASVRETEGSADTAARLRDGAIDAGIVRFCAAMLDEVTNIKLEALDRLTHEELCGDGTFSIFLTQCANLISKIQLKILEQSRKDL